MTSELYQEHLDTPWRNGRIRFTAGSGGNHISLISNARNEKRSKDRTRGTGFYSYPRRRGNIRIKPLKAAVASLSTLASATKRYFRNLAIPNVLSVILRDSEAVVAYGWLGSRKRCDPSNYYVKYRWTTRTGIARGRGNAETIKTR